MLITKHQCFGRKQVTIHERAGQLPFQSDLINVAQLTAQYYTQQPQPGNTSQAVKFGTSGHRGSSLRKNFNENHILAIAQAIADLRKKQGVTGPCRERYPCVIRSGVYYSG